MREALEAGRREIRALLERAFKSPDVSVNHPDYAQAFGIAQGLALVTLMQEPSLSTSEFHEIWSELERRRTDATPSQRRAAAQDVKNADLRDVAAGPQGPFTFTPRKKRADPICSHCGTDGHTRRTCVVLDIARREAERRGEQP